MASKLIISTLRYATSAAKNSIGSCAPSHPASATKLSDFKVTSVVGVTPDKTSVAYGDTVTFKLNFSGENSQFFNIKKIASNYISSVSFTPSDCLTFVSETEDSKTYKNNLLIYNSASYVDGTVNLKFYDKGYNIDATNYNSAFSKAIRLYRAPKPIISYNSSSGPPRPCCGDIYATGACCDASITINYDSNSTFGVNSSRIDLYYKTTGIDFTLFSTVYTNTGTASKGGLSGNTTYTFKAINSLGVSSDTIDITTPAYV